MADRAEYYGTCNHCRKRLYASRKAARRAARRIHPGEQLSAYPCPVLEGFHFGHLGEDVVSGRRTREETYRWTRTQIRRTASRS